MSGRTSTVSFPVLSASVPRVRSHIDELARKWDLPQRVVDDAVLVGSELATNVLVHAEGIGEFFELHLEHPGDVLLLEVADSYRWCMPEKREPASWDVTGRGLLLVDAVALAWGVRERDGAGKAVWVRLSAS